MEDPNLLSPDQPEQATPSTDWAGLRAQAAKLGISLSELQQREREKKIRLERKARSRVSIPAPVEPLATPEPEAGKTDPLTE